MNLDALAKSLCPPLLAPSIKRLSGRGLRFDGSPRNWEEALRRSSGYSDPDILGRVVAATREVIAGRAAYERDSVLFHEPNAPFHTLFALLRSAVQDEGRLEVIDFGGSLGSTYRHCRPFLAGLQRLHWHIVEQPGFVDAGRSEFAGPELHFHASIDEIPVGSTPFTFILSSVLQYLERPDAVLQLMQGLRSRHLVIDRSPFSRLDDDRLCIQHAPKSVYRASYPCWIFSRSRVLRMLSQHWELVSDHACPEGVHRDSDGNEFEFRGLILERRR